MVPQYLPGLVQIVQKFTLAFDHLELFVRRACFVQLLARSFGLLAIDLRVSAWRYDLRNDFSAPVSIDGRGYFVRALERLGQVTQFILSGSYQLFRPTSHRSICGISKHDSADS